MWSGGEGMRRAWSTYTGFNWAPLGKLSDDGLRIRATGGYGQYRYDAVVDHTPQSIYGTAAFGDLLVGYQMGFGQLTLKGFAGASFDGHLLQPFDEANTLSKPATGVKLALEAWYNVTDKTWAQTDLSWSNAHDVYGGRMRLGYRVYEGFMQDVSAGVEAGTHGNVSGDNARAGLFVRYAWFGGELSASAGVSGPAPTQNRSVSQMTKPYGTLVYLKRY